MPTAEEVIPTQEELIDAIEKQEGDVYKAVGDDEERSVRDVYTDLIEIEEAFEQATKDEDAEAVAEAKQGCEEFAGELATLINGLQVGLGDMLDGLDALEEVALEGYTVSDA